MLPRPRPIRFWGKLGSRKGELHLLRCGRQHPHQRHPWRPGPVALAGKAASHPVPHVCCVHKLTSGKLTKHDRMHFSGTDMHLGVPGLLLSRKSAGPPASYVCCMLCIHQHDSDTSRQSLSNAKSSRVNLVGGKPVKGGLAVPKEVEGQLLRFCLA